MRSTHTTILPEGRIRRALCGVWAIITLTAGMILLLAAPPSTGRGNAASERSPAGRGAISLLHSELRILETGEVWGSETIEFAAEAPVRRLVRRFPTAGAFPSIGELVPESAVLDGVGAPERRLTSTTSAGPASGTLSVFLSDGAPFPPGKNRVVWQFRVKPGLSFSQGRAKLALPVSGVERRVPILYARCEAVLPPGVPPEAVRAWGRLSTDVTDDRREYVQASIGWSDPATTGGRSRVLVRLDRRNLEPDEVLELEVSWPERVVAAAPSREIRGVVATPARRPRPPLRSR